jgi:hypothetical protein
MKKKFMFILAAAALLAALATGCGGGGDDTTTQAPEPSPSVSVPPDESPAVPTETEEPTGTPSDEPSTPPTDTPSDAPTGTPTGTPTETPSDTPAPPDEPTPTGGGSEPSAPPATPPDEPETPTPEPPDVAPPVDVSALLDTIVAGANELLDENSRLGMTFVDPVTADNCQGRLGLTPEQFAEYVVGASTSNAAIMSIAHEVALIECADADAAATVKSLVAKGFDSLQWICVYPERSVVVESGNYVLLAATRADFADAVTESFTAVMGGAGQPDTFYTGPEH